MTDGEGRACFHHHAGRPRGPDTDVGPELDQDPDPGAGLERDRDQGPLHGEVRVAIPTLYVDQGHPEDPGGGGLYDDQDEEEEEEEEEEEGSGGWRRRKRRRSSRRADGGAAEWSPISPECHEEEGQGADVGSGGGPGSGSGSGLGSVSGLGVRIRAPIRDPDCTSEEEEEQQPYPGLAPVVFFCVKQTTRPRSWCLRMVCNPYPLHTLSPVPNHGRQQHQWLGEWKDTVYVVQ
ncbi:unnamed protein product [Merluccius merluccius]